MTKRLSKETVDQVKQYSGIVEYIGNYVQLKRRGQNYIGLCPFHSEKSPSFTVSPSKGIFHCFGCRESGDLISFAQKIDHLSFAESIESIARFAGLPVHYADVSQSELNRQTLIQQQFNALGVAKEFFSQQLTKESVAYQYIQRRNLNSDSIELFSLGFCSSSNDLYSFLIKHNISKSLIQQLSLFSSQSSSLYCRFLRRLIFPISDFQGRIVGFGGRILTQDKDTAKYVNSDESLLFNKRKLLYGLYQAKSFVRKAGYLILVEGYMDVIMCSQFGFNHVAACMGTALTVEQVRLVQRVTNNVVLMFDNDSAGQQSMFKSIQILQQEQVEVDVVALAECDPADYLSRYGKESFEGLLKQKQPAFEFMYDFIKQGFNLNDIHQVSKCVKQIIPLVSALKDDVLRKFYIRKIVQDLNVDEEIVVANVDRMLYNEPAFSQVHIKNNAKETKLQKAQQFVIVSIAVDLGLRNYMKEVDLNLFVDQDKKQLCSDILNSSKTDSELISQLNDVQQKSLTNWMISMPEYASEIQLKNIFNDCLGLLQSYQKQDVINGLKEKIRQMESNGLDQDVLPLLQELDQLKKGGDNDNKVK